MIKLLLPALIALTLIMVDLSESKADSLVCYYSGTNRIMVVFTEEYDSKEYRAVKSILIGTNWSQVTYHDRKTVFFNGSVPCLVIGDNRSEKINLNEFYRQIR